MIWHILYQKILRAHSYKSLKELQKEQGVTDILGDETQIIVGRKIVLASTFISSKTWYNSEFQDAMAICQELCKPDYFITLTFNPDHNLCPVRITGENDIICATLFFGLHKLYSAWRVCEDQTLLWHT